MGIINVQSEGRGTDQVSEEKLLFFFSSGLVRFMVQLSEALDLGVMEWEWIFQDM